MRRPSHSPTVTAGLKWPPEMCPNAYATVSTARPNASATPSKADPDVVEAGAEHGGAAAGEHQPERADQLDGEPPAEPGRRRFSHPSTLLAPRRGGLTRGA